MTPFGGISVIFHAVIVMIYQKPKIMISLVILSILFMVLGSSALSIFQMALGNLSGNTTNFGTYVYGECIPFNSKPNDRTIILRLDDIQAHTFRDSAVRMIHDTLANRMPISLGVIPHNVNDDTLLLSFLQERNCNLEFAIHGWNHREQPPEFFGLSEDEAYEKLIKGKGVLDEISFHPVTTFIPPRNVYSPGTLKAVERAEMIISAEGNEKYDYTATTYDWDSNQLVPVSEVVSKCKRGLEENNLCIIMIHPQDYRSNNQHNEEKYTTYIDLLIELRELDASFRTFTQYLN